MTIVIILLLFLLWWVVITKAPLSEPIKTFINIAFAVLVVLMLLHILGLVNINWNLRS